MSLRVAAHGALPFHRAAQPEIPASGGPRTTQ